MKKRNMLGIVVLLLGVFALFVTSNAGAANIGSMMEHIDLTDEEIDALFDRGEHEEIEFDVSEIYFELNDTDGDLGIHGLIDGEPWKWIRIEKPNGRQVMRINNHSSFRRQGITELFFESAEPTFDELPPEVFFARFPEGVWEVEGLSQEGFELEGEAYLSHVIPAAPAGITANGEELPEDCDEDPVPVVTGPVTIAWEPVTEHHEELGEEGDVEAVLYEVVVEIDDTDMKLVAYLPGDVTEYTLSEDFTDLASEFKVEVLVYADNNNRSATETCFEMEEED